MSRSTRINLIIGAVILLILATPFLIPLNMYRGQIEAAIPLNRWDMLVGCNLAEAEDRDADRLHLRPSTYARALTSVSSADWPGW